MPPAGIVRCGEALGDVTKVPVSQVGLVRRSNLAEGLPDTRGDRTVWKGHHRRSEVSGKVTGCATGGVGNTTGFLSVDTKRLIRGRSSGADCPLQSRDYLFCL